MRPFKRAAGRLVVREIPTEQPHPTQSSPPVGRIKFRRPRSRTLWPARSQALTTRAPLFGSWRGMAVCFGLALLLFLPGEGKQTPDTVGGGGGGQRLSLPSPLVPLSVVFCGFFRAAWE